MHSVDFRPNCLPPFAGYFGFGLHPLMSPSDAAWQQLISAVHASGRKAAIAITGGGSGAVGELLRIPGGSRLLIEAQIPYDAAALGRFSALRRRRRAAPTRRSRWRKAHGHAPPGWCRPTPIWSDSARRRRWSAIARAEASIGFISRSPMPPASRTAPACWPREGVIARPRKSLCRARSSYGWPAPAELPHRRRAACSIRTNIMPRLRSPPAMRSIGSWQANSIASPSSPTVRGCCRRRLPLCCSRVLSTRCTRDTSCWRASPKSSGSNRWRSKSLSRMSTSRHWRARRCRHRLAQFAWKAPVELTRAPTFVEKSRLFPRTTFIIGVDTAERLFGPKYYDDDEARMHMALEEIASSGGSFLVAVRVDAAGRVRALADIPVPRRYADLFTEIPEHHFRVDISSSEIRARGRAPSSS